MELADLKEMINTGNFHHATYRNQGTIWEGLWIYAKEPNGFRGYSVVGCFNASNPDSLREAENLCRGTGISLGAYGQG